VRGLLQGVALQLAGGGEQQDILATLYIGLRAGGMLVVRAKRLTRPRMCT
jgi:hypothetical protein